MQKKQKTNEINQDYDILYFCDGEEYDDIILNDINHGAEIYRRRWGIC